MVSSSGLRQSVLFSNSLAAFAKLPDNNPGSKAPGIFSETFIFSSFNFYTMNRTTKSLTILGLFLAIIASSCKKDTLPDNRSILSSQYNEAKTNQRILLANPFIVE